jgi:hypothetical protein
MAHVITVAPQKSILNASAHKQAGRDSTNGIPLRQNNERKETNK